MVGAESESRRCGRPTKSGSPCRGILYGVDVACGTHATEQDREIGRLLSETSRRSFESGRSLAEGEVERLTRRVRELEQRLDREQRVYEVGGDQVVEVGKHSYRWSGAEPLAVGDQVMLPENWVSKMKHGPGPYEATVTGLGTTYRGDLSSIVRCVATESQEEGERSGVETEFLGRTRGSTRRRSLDVR